MAGPASPSEGPTFAPPPLPPGWIAQWDGSSKKYYYVQLSTGVSQWETPTEAAPVGGTPAATLDHPYGVPGADRKPEVITHPDGSQTVKHPDGRLEPVLPPEDGARAGMNGAATGERGLGVSFLTSPLMAGQTARRERQLADWTCRGRVSLAAYSTHPQARWDRCSEAWHIREGVAAAVLPASAGSLRRNWLLTCSRAVATANQDRRKITTAARRLSQRIPEGWRAP